MLHPYGYVRGTLGTDGDEVDVYVGPNKESEKVFVVTQLKKPEFKTVDEQKVMLGFGSAREAKSAYLKHYDDPRFFKDMKEVTMEEFKNKLGSQKGKLIKGELYIFANSGKISDIVMKKSKKAAIDEEKLDIKKDMPDSSCEKINKKVQSDPPLGADSKEKSVSKSYIEKLEDTFKALSSVVASSISRRARMEARVEQHNALASVSNQVANHEMGIPETADVANDAPVIGTDRAQAPGEPPVVPIRMIHNGPLSITPCEAEVFKSCNSCGTMTKSTVPCRRCDQLESMKGSGTVWST